MLGKVYIDHNFVPVIKVTDEKADFSQLGKVVPQKLPKGAGLARFAAAMGLGDTTSAARGGV